MNDRNNNTQENNLTLTRAFNVSVERAREAWTQSEYVKQWWWPPGFTCPLAEMDVREGGRTPDLYASSGEVWRAADVECLDKMAAIFEEK